MTEPADEILLELNRRQALIGTSSNASWTNTIPNLKLNKGDQIRFLGGWLNVKNSGDQSIEITNIENPNDDIDISFLFSFYKTLNAQNVITFPYHSYKWTTENSYDQSYLGYGFSADPLATGRNDWNLSNTTNAPLLNGITANPYMDSGFLNKSLAKYATYDSLINEQDADKYNLSRDTGYIHFLVNAGLRQGWRDEANNNDRYTLMYQKTSGKWDVYTQKVDAKFKPSYLTPENIASFITESMQQQRKLVTSYKDTTPIKEVWTNSGRFFQCLEPFALPNVNCSTVPSGFFRAGTDATNSNTKPLSTQASWGSIASDCPAQTGFITDFDLTPTEITYEDPTQTVIGVGNYCRIRGDYEPTSKNDARMWNYIFHMARKYTGSNSLYGKQTVTQSNYMYGTDGTDITMPSSPSTTELDAGYPQITAYSVHKLKLHNPEEKFYQIGISNKDEQGFQGVNGSGTIGGTAFGSMAFFNPANPLPNSTLAVSNFPISFDANTGQYGKYSMEIFLYSVDDQSQTGVTFSGNSAGMTVALNPTLKLRLSVGGNPIQDLFVLADPPPMGSPLIVGNECNTYAGQPIGNTEFNANFPANKTVQFAYRMMETQTKDPFTFMPYILDVSGGKLDLADGTSATSDAFTLNINTHINHSKIDYTAGNRAIGCTAMNFHRWSLLNFQKPAQTDDPENEISFTPTLVKFPNFRKTGCELWNTHGFMMNLDRNLSTVTFHPREQDTNFLVEEENYPSLASVKTRCEKYRNFFNAQIDDGMIDPSQTQLTDSGGRSYFPAYIHIGLELGASNYRANGTKGSGVSWRERPRGFLISVDEASFNSPDPIISSNNPDSGYIGGVRYIIDSSGNYKIYVQGYSWIYDKSFTSIWQNESTGQDFPTTCNFGYLDINAVSTSNWTGGSSVTYTLAKLKDALGNSVKLQECDNGVANILNLGFGFSDENNAWRGNMGYLCSSDVRKAESYQYLYSSTKNRQSSNYECWYETQSRPKLLYEKGDGFVEYSNRIFIGAREPLLQFATDGSSRFFFSQLFNPIQVSNEYDAGTTIADETEIQNNCCFTLYNLVDKLSENVTITLGDSSTSPPTPDTFSVNIPTNEEAGNDAVFYQRKIWNISHDGLMILAPEIPKHFPMNWKMKSAVPNNTNRFCGNQWGNGTFYYNYPILDDDLYNTRFFCFPQQARLNSFEMKTQLRDRFQQDQLRDSSQNLINVDNIQLQTKRNLSNHFWGSMPSANLAFITRDRKVGQANQVREFQAGIDCPKSENIYDCNCGVAMYDFLQNNKDNWDSSLWSTLGFIYSDLNPSPFVGITNQRNFTKNFLKDDPTDNYSKDVFHSRSYPITCNAELTSSGFQQDTTNLIGQNNFTPVTPLSTILFTGNLIKEDNDSSFLFNLTNEIGNNAGYDVIFQSTGGASLANNEIFDYQFFNLKISSGLPFGSYVTATNTAQKLKVPFYLIRSNLVQNNFEFINNANQPSQMNVVGNVSLQYGATTDFYYSENQFENVYINKTDRLVTEIHTELVDSDGNLASTLEDNSSIFVRITRADPVPNTMTDKDNLFLLEKLINKESKTDFKEYEKEIEEILGVEN